jgi:nucleoside-diphosphate-sugar epimerase
MRVLLAGAYGQVGQELIRALSAKIGLNNVVCADLREPPSNVKVNIHEKLDILSKDQLAALCEKHKITEVYCLAALLSATGEKNPLTTEKINMTGLFNCL